MIVDKKLMKAVRKDRVKTRQIIQDCRDTGVSRELTKFYIEGGDNNFQRGLLQAGSFIATGTLFMGLNYYTIHNLVNNYLENCSNDVRSWVHVCGASVLAIAILPYLAKKTLRLESKGYCDIKLIAEINREAIQGTSYPAEGQSLLEEVL